MSLLDKAVKFRNRFLNRHLIGKSLGLLNRAESFIFLKNSENINFDYKFDSQNEKKDKKNFSNAFTADDNASKNKNEKKYELNNLDLEEPALDEKFGSKKDFFVIINKISNELAIIELKDHSYDYFNKIIIENFGFNKNAILVYSSRKQQFITKTGENIDNETINKLAFDLKFMDIYKNLIKNNYLYIKDKEQIHYYSKLFSKKDFNKIDFILIMPFILSSHVIGLFIGLKLENGKKPEMELISSLEIICKQNGSLLYNIIQNEK